MGHRPTKTSTGDKNMNSNIGSQVIDVTRIPASGKFSGRGPCLASILEQIAGLLNRYIYLPHSSLEILIACWITLTYCFEKFEFCGYLTIQSATPRCGKSRLITLIRYLVNGTPPISTIPTPANLYRSPHKVILLDEVDKLRNRDKENYGEVLAVLNLGFQKGGTIQRLEKTSSNNFVQRDFDVYGPKLLAGIESLADTLADRSFAIRMARSPKRPPRLNTRHLAGEFNDIRQSLDQWIAQHAVAIEEVYDQLPDEVEELKDYDDRFQDISEPLWVLAIIADAEHVKENPNIPSTKTIHFRLLLALKELAKNRTPSGKEEAFRAFHTLAGNLLNGQNQVFVSTKDLVKECVKIEELDWINHPRKLASFLRPFDLYPVSNGNCRGYTLTNTWVQDWGNRYGIP